MLLSSLRFLQKLRHQQWLAKRELQEIQLKNLKVIVDYAYRNVPYYRSLFNSNGVRPEDVRGLDDLQRIPISTRLDIQNLPPDHITSSDIPEHKFKRVLTSGSSGIPLTIYRMRREEDIYDMIWARTFLEDGKSLWDRTADLKFHFPRKRWFEFLGVWRRDVISLLEDPSTQLRRLQEVNPDVIRGSPFELANLARRAEELKVDHVNPSLIFSMGSLLDSQSRALIERTFHCEVFDCYATSEVGTIAWECPAHQGQHINIDTLVLELVRDGKAVGPGEQGRVVCTGLYSFGMPFIRYDIGDVAVAREESCGCGRGLPMLKSLDGRADDFFVSKDGRLHSPSVIVNQVKSIIGIRQFRLTQESPTSIRAEIVPDGNYSVNTDNQIRAMMERIIGEDLNLSVEKAVTLKRDPSGKIRSLISKVRKEF